MTTTAITLKGDPQSFPVGATVTAYLRTNWPTFALPPSGAPRGASAASTTVAADGTIPFTGLTAGGKYFAVVDLDPGGSHNYRYMRFTVGDSSDLDAGLPVSRGVLDAATGLLVPASVYRKLIDGQANLSTTAAAGNKYFFVPNLQNALTLAPGSGSQVSFPILDLVAADLAIPGLTTKLKLKAQAAIGSVVPARTFTIGLYPLTAGGNFVLGTVVPGSTAAIASPTGASPSAAGNKQESGDFALPVDGAYAFGVTVSGAPADNVEIFAQLVTHAVP